MIPHNKPSLSLEESEAAAKVISSNALVNGYHTKAFEDEMCQFLSLPQGHAVCVSSGSSALFLAIRLLNLSGKNVALPSYSCRSLLHACTLNQATPVYLDNKKDEPIFTYPRQHFDGLIYPYLYGLSSKLSIPTKPVIIEDIAQALGARYQDKALGTIGDIGVLSFYATKMITSGGQGGMLVSKNKALIDSAREFLAFEKKYNEFGGFNFHITEMQSAIARIQLAKLPSFIEKRENIWRHYQAAKLPLLDIVDSNAHSVRYRAIVKTSDPIKLIHKLAQHGITAINPFTADELLSDSTTNAKSLTEQTVSIPIYPSLDEADAIRIANLCAKELDIL